MNLQIRETVKKNIKKLLFSNFKKLFSNYQWEASHIVQVILNTLCENMLVLHQLCGGWPSQSRLVTSSICEIFVISIYKEINIICIKSKEIQIYKYYLSPQGTLPYNRSYYTVRAREEIECSNEAESYISGSVLLAGPSLTGGLIHGVAQSMSHNDPSCVNQYPGLSFLAIYSFCSISIQRCLSVLGFSLISTVENVKNCSVAQIISCKTANPTFISIMGSIR